MDDIEGGALLYLLDANVLIDAHRQYYAVDRVPEFWDWLEDQGAQGNIKIPLEIYEEIQQGKEDDPLAMWTRRADVQASLLLAEGVNVQLVDQVVSTGYAPDLSDDEIQKLGRDPFLIAYGLVMPESRCVVTTEVSKPGRLRANRHIPDVCKDLGIRTCSTFALTRELDFRTNWKHR